MENVEYAVAGLLGTLLARLVGPEDDLAMETCPAWDSLKHIEIIMTVEERFGVSFEPEDIPRLTTQRRLVEKIAEMATKTAKEPPLA